MKKRPGSTRNRKQSEGRKNGLDEIGTNGGKMFYRRGAKKRRAADAKK
jgi:hypothetical protein